MKVWVSAAWFLAGVLVTAATVVVAVIADGDDPAFQVEDCTALDEMR